MQHGDHQTTARPRPSQGEIEPAALRVIARHGPLILGSARRYSLGPEDAEDAYQRGLEILLTKAPTTSEAELVPWLRTVVKHEALAIRRQRQRATPTEDDQIDGAATGGDRGPVTHEQAERLERLRVGAEAMERLKPQEVRCLLLLAEGYSYRQICDATGFTYTKVNRCITEGRRSFLARVAAIESGAECERYEPLLSTLADGEAKAADVAILRPHLRTCLACRATLREYRQAPARVAALAPPLALTQGLLTRGGEWVSAWLQDRAALVAFKVQTVGELVAAQVGVHKAAALAATTAALAGGSVAGVGSGDPRDARRAALERAGGDRDVARSARAGRAGVSVGRLNGAGEQGTERASAAGSPRQSDRVGRERSTGSARGGEQARASGTRGDGASGSGGGERRSGPPSRAAPQRAALTLASASTPTSLTPARTAQPTASGPPRRTSAPAPVRKPAAPSPRRATPAPEPAPPRRAREADAPSGEFGL